MGQLGKRLVSSAFLIAASLSTIFWAPLWLFLLVEEALALCALGEYLRMAEKKGYGVRRLPVMVLGALIPPAMNYLPPAAVAVAVCVLVCILYLGVNETAGAFASVTVTVFGLLYIVWFFSHLALLRQMESGAGWVFYVILLTKGGDAGAYFVGSSYGRRKLCERISPNKSVEGALAGLATTVVLSLISGLYLRGAGLGHLAALGLIVGVVAQLGDLAESLLKRDAGVKDSGEIPGLGGILDVLDSLLLTVPLVYYYAHHLIVI
jgi:phosphatidate cytidylyltransferase